MLKKILFIIAGYLALFLGIAGIFLPLLPTTPFLLLSAACFFRGSDSLYKWLINHKVLGGYIKSYRLYRAVSLKTKVFSVALLWLTISTSAIFFVSLMWVRILLLVIAIGVTVHILSHRTLTKEMLEQMDSSDTDVL